MISRLLDATGVVVKNITPAVATIATQLSEDVPANPADRLVTTTARAEGLALVTQDAKLRASYAVRTIC